MNTAAEITAASSAHAIAAEIDRLKRLQASTDSYIADLVEMHEVAKARENQCRGESR